MTGTLMSRWRTPAVDLDDAVVLVTGPTSGIGRSVAHELARRGTTLVLLARNADELQRVAEECRSLGAPDVHVVPADVGDLDAVRRAVDESVERFGRIDAAISNAGVMAYGRFDEVPAEVHERVIRTNLLGTVYVASAVLPVFVRQHHGVLVNVGSLYGEITTPHVASYVASKFAVLGLTRALRRDTGARPGVDVCCVMPSSIDTPIFRHAANHSGHPVRAIPPAIPVERVTRVIVGCLRHPRKEVRVGVIGTLVAYGQKLAPWVYDRSVRRAFERLGFDDGTAPIDDGNVFEPAHTWNTPDGGWSRSPTTVLVSPLRS